MRHIFAFESKKCKYDRNRIRAVVSAIIFSDKNRFSEEIFTKKIAARAVGLKPAQHKIILVANGSATSAQFFCYFTELFPYCGVICTLPSGLVTVCSACLFNEISSGSNLTD